MTPSSLIDQTTPPRWRRDDLLHEWDFLRRQGFTVGQAAERLGITQHALDQALHRAQRAGDPRATRKAAA